MKKWGIKRGTRMKTTCKFISIYLLLIPLLLNNMCASVTDTFAYFTDVEYSAGNTLTAGVWGNGTVTNSEADFLTVSDDSKLTENGKKLDGITLDVNGTQNVTIDKIQVWWDLSQGNTSHITKVTIYEKEFFSGNKSAGEMIDGVDYLLEAGSPAKFELDFDSNVSDLTPFTINIIMGDESVKSFVTDSKYRSDVPEA